MLTTAVTVAVPARPGPVVDTEAWSRWLRQRLAPPWREGEWDPRTWTFTGDPDNPSTSIVRCRTVNCPSLLAGRTVRFCSPCDKTRAESGLPAEDFAATHQPARSASPGSAREPCRVSRDGLNCARSAACTGMCDSHYAAWRAHARRAADTGQTVEMAEWIARYANPVLAALPACLVPACRKLSCSGRGLCYYHVIIWRQARRNAGAGTPQEWAAGQIPYLAGHQFSLLALPELLRWEVLFGLQHGDTSGRVRSLSTHTVRLAVQELGGMGVTTLLDELPPKKSLHRRDKNIYNQVRNWFWTARVGFDEFTGVKPTDKTVLDLRAVGLSSMSPAGGLRRVTGTADLGTIEQLWLRQLLQRWVELEHPTSDMFGNTLHAVRIAARALAQRPGGGHDPSALRFTDMSAVIRAIWSQTRPDGTLYSPNTASSRQAILFKLFDYGGRAGLLDDLGASFLHDRKSHPTGRPRHKKNAEDEVGKAVPESIIAQLDTQLHTLGAGAVYGTSAIAADDLRAMYQTTYVLLRDTGRRPTEIAALGRDCLEDDRGEISLIWDNRKNKRHRRRLPITSETAAAVRAWQQRRDQLAVPTRAERMLFPAPTVDSPASHISAAAISEAMRIWVDGLPELLSDELDELGNRAPFDRSKIYPYAFRHSFAQRHADAGTPTDVLRELMDHRSIETTAKYYTVSMKRRRRAVAALSAHVVDRHGTPTACSTSAYQMRSVAVPYGGCTEPSNIKAGGRACPIRFQCAGCGFYRPDPSYLLAIEQHINELRAGRETARAMDSATFVINAMTEEISAYEAIAATMRTKLADLPADERAEIEQASVVLRKLRAAAGNTTALPLTVITRAPGRQPGDQ